MGFMGVIFEWFSKVNNILNENGYIKTFITLFFMICFSIAGYVAMNPRIIFEKYKEYEEQVHSASFDYRMKVSPFVDDYTQQILDECGGIRAFVIEMHNGKYNAAGLSFNYGSMTYEAINDTVESIREDYADFTLERYKLITKVYNDGYWSGNIEELSDIDKRLSLKLESNDAKYIAIASIYGVKNEIGFIGVTFSDDMTENSGEIERILKKYSSKISPLLDGQKTERE